ncbi:Fic/DOC family protein [Halovulum sp. GXIMD14793]
MSDEVYCYPPDFNVLKNKLSLREADELDYFEREFVYARAMQEMPTGDFDLAHLCAIHRHLFQDVYDWAGQVRTVEISKGGSQFQPKAYIETGMTDVHCRILGQDYLRGLSPDEFSKQVGHIIGDVNYVHPFREGNGRTQLYFYKQLASRAGHDGKRCIRPFPAGLPDLAHKRYSGATRHKAEQKNWSCPAHSFNSLNHPIATVPSVKPDIRCERKGWYAPAQATQIPWE